MKTFEDYLKDIHAKDYHGTDDAMPDALESWLDDMDKSEMMEHAEKFVQIISTVVCVVCKRHILLGKNPPTPAA